MSDDSVGTPLSRRVPGANRPGPSPSGRAVLPESVLNRMRAAIDAEHAQAQALDQGEPPTDPLPRVIVSDTATSEDESPASSPVTMLADTAVLPKRNAKSERPATQRTTAHEPLPAYEAPASVPLAATTATAPPDLVTPTPAAAPVGTTAPSAPVTPTPAAAPPAATTPTSAPPLRTARPPHPATAPRPARPPRGPKQSRPTTGPGRGRSRTAVLAAVAGVLLVAAGLVVGKSLDTTTVASPPTTKPSAAPATKASTAASASAAEARALAISGQSTAAWFAAHQVSSDAVVACDPRLCALLTASGFPTVQEYPLGQGSVSLINTNLIVVTPAIRFLLGTMHPHLGADVLPAILASFGSGSAQITIQAVDPDGAAAYEAALRQDVRARVQLGTQLLSGGNVSATPTARNELAQGEVDPRLLLAIQALADQEPVDILSFGDAGPSTSPGVPLRSADFAETDPASQTFGPGYRQTMISVFRTHSGFPSITGAAEPMLADGQTVLQIEFGVPTPLNLLSPP